MVATLTRQNSRLESRNRKKTKDAAHRLVFRFSCSCLRVWEGRALTRPSDEHTPSLSAKTNPCYTPHTVPSRRKRTKADNTHAERADATSSNRRVGCPKGSQSTGGRCARGGGCLENGAFAYEKEGGSGHSTPDLLLVTTRKPRKNAAWRYHRRRGRGGSHAGDCAPAKDTCCRGWRDSGIGGVLRGVRCAA